MRFAVSAGNHRNGVGVSMERGPGWLEVLRHCGQKAGHDSSNCFGVSGTAPRPVPEFRESTGIRQIDSYSGGDGRFRGLPEKS